MAGEVDNIGGSKVDINVNMINLLPGGAGNASFERTSAHEFGHLGGLEHPANPIENLMTQTRFTGNMSITSPQIETMWEKERTGQLNQGIK